MDNSVKKNQKKTAYGYTNQILEVDLDTRSFQAKITPPEDKKLYLGGKGLALKQIYDRQSPGADPLGKDNILAFANGPVTGTGAPCSARFSAVAKSPLTGIFTHSSCGGPFGYALKTSGWDLLLLRGISEKPVYLIINSDGVLFKDASALWGKSTSETSALIKGEGDGSLVIGPAGENRVPLACIRSGSRFLGRGGLGAVMGSKRVKAIVSLGKEYIIKPQNQAAFKKITKTFTRYLKRNSVTGGDYHTLGTSAHVLKTNQESILPVHNFRETSHPKSSQISGEQYHRYQIKERHSCKFCAIRCGHLGRFRETELPVPEYETIGLLGSNLGIFEPERVAYWNHLCGEMGLDTISTGGTLAWAMEASEKGLYPSPLKFGRPDHVTDAIKGLATQSNSFKDLKMGSRALSEKFGGTDFAIQAKGLELAAYHPGKMVGQSLSYAVANRGGCHLSGTLFAIEAFFKLIPGGQSTGKPVMVKYFEDLYSAVNSMHICQFTGYAAIFEMPLIKLTPGPVLKILMTFLPSLALKLIPLTLYPRLLEAVTGEPLSVRDFKKAGARIHLLERVMNTREGISRQDDTLPRRLLSESKERVFNKLLNKYYQLRGYDSNGIPAPQILENHSITPKDNSVP